VDVKALARTAARKAARQLGGEIREGLASLRRELLTDSARQLGGPPGLPVSGRGWAWGEREEGERRGPGRAQVGA
jgi:hypothetical protein